jgi:hypothetical protein
LSALTLENPAFAYTGSVDYPEFFKYNSPKKCQS